MGVHREYTPTIRGARATRFVALARDYSSVASVATACFGAFVEPVLDSDISSRATWVRRLSAISSSARDRLKSAPTAGRPIAAAMHRRVPQTTIVGNGVVRRLFTIVHKRGVDLSAM